MDQTRVNNVNNKSAWSPFLEHLMLRGVLPILFSQSSLPETIEWRISIDFQCNFRRTVRNEVGNQGVSLPGGELAMTYSLSAPKIPDYRFSVDNQRI